jgi:hypothetical protein
MEERVEEGDGTQGSTEVKRKGRCEANKMREEAAVAVAAAEEPRQGRL